MTLLERLSKPAGQYGSYWFQRHEVEELCLALAIAQAVDKMTHVEQKKAILDCADELLRGDK